MPCLVLLLHGEGYHEKAMLGTEKGGLDAELLSFGHLLLAGGDRLVIYHYGRGSAVLGSNKAPIHCRPAFVSYGFAAGSSFDDSSASIPTP